VSPNVSCWVSFFLFASFSFFPPSPPPNDRIQLRPRISFQKERVDPNNKTYPGYILLLFVRGTGAVVREGPLKIQDPPNRPCPARPKTTRTEEGDACSSDEGWGSHTQCVNELVERIQNAKTQPRRCSPERGREEATHFEERLHAKRSQQRKALARNEVF